MTRKGQQQGHLDVMNRLLDRLGFVEEDVHLRRGRQLLLDLRQQAADILHHLDGVGAGLALDGQQDAAVVVEPGGYTVVLHAVVDTGELLQAHRRTIAIGHHDRPELGGAVELTGRLDCE